MYYWVRQIFDVEKVIFVSTTRAALSTKQISQLTNSIFLDKKIAIKFKRLPTHRVHNIVTFYNLSEILREKKGEGGGQII